MHHQPDLKDAGEEVGEDVGGVAEGSQVVGQEDDGVKCQPGVPELLAENGTKEMVVHLLGVVDHFGTWGASNTKKMWFFVFFSRPNQNFSHGKLKLLSP